MRRMGNCFRLLLFVAVVLEYVAITYAFVLIVSCKVSADSFFPDGEIEHSLFYTTIAFGVEHKLPDSKIIFNQDMLSGRSKTALELLRFNSVVLKNEPYTRSSDSPENVAMAPGDELFVSLLAYNRTGHLVAIKNSWLFLQQYQKPGLEDIVTVNLSSLNYRNIAINYRGVLITKGGRSIDFGPLGNIPDAEVSPEGFSRVFSLGKIENHIQVLSTKVSCEQNLEGKVSRLLDLEVLNTGNIHEVTVLEANDLGMIAPGQTKLFSKIPLAQLAGDVRLQLPLSVTRCLQFSDGKGYVSPLDEHAFLVARNDDRRWQWGGILPNMRNELDGESFCVTRIPYEIEVPINSCSRPPAYRVNVESESVSLPSSSRIVVPLVVKNHGGPSDVRALLQITVPEPWRELTALQYVDHGQLREVLMNTIDQERLPLPLLDSSEEFHGSLIIKSEEFFSREQSSAFVIDLQVGNLRDSVEVVPVVVTSVIVTDAKFTCEGGGGYLKINLHMIGNGFVSTVKVPIRIIHGNLSLEDFRSVGNNTTSFQKEGAESYVVVTELSIKDEYLLIEVYVKTRRDDCNNIVLAVSGNTARGACNECKGPVEKEKRILAQSTLSQKNLSPNSIRSPDGDSKSLARSIQGIKSAATDPKKPPSNPYYNVAFALLVLSISSIVLIPLFFCCKPRKSG